MINVIQCSKRYDAEHLVGTFCDQRHYDKLIEGDTDCYAPSLYPTRSEENIVFKFRRGAFTKLEQRLAYDGLRPAAVSSQNWGLAAGPRGEGAGGRDWVAEYQLEALLSLSEQSGANLKAIGKERGSKAECRGYVWLQKSVLADHGDYHGWFDRWLSAIINQPPDVQKRWLITFCGPTSQIRLMRSQSRRALQATMTVTHVYHTGGQRGIRRSRSNSTSNAFPTSGALMRSSSGNSQNDGKRQRDAANCIDPRFTICGSVFSTLTVNHNWRTAAHRDAGDLNAGFSSIAAFTGHDGTGWKGGELILPEYRVAINLRAGDLLLVNAHECIHANAPSM